MEFLRIGLIFSMLIIAFRIFSWFRVVFLFITKPKGKTSLSIKNLGVSKTHYIIGGLEHLIMFASLLAATLIIF